MTNIWLRIKTDIEQAKAKAFDLLDIELLL